MELLIKSIANACQNTVLRLNRACISLAPASIACYLEHTQLHAYTYMYMLYTMKDFLKMQGGLIRQCHTGRARRRGGVLPGLSGGGHSCACSSWRLLIKLSAYGRCTFINHFPGIRKKYLRVDIHHHFSDGAMRNLFFCSCFIGT